MLYRNLVPGRRYDLAAKFRLRVSVGIPRIVDVAIDGRPAFLADPNSGRISRVLIDQANRERFFAPAVAEEKPTPPNASDNAEGGEV